MLRNLSIQPRITIVRFCNIPQGIAPAKLIGHRLAKSSRGRSTCCLRGFRSLSLLRPLRCSLAGSLLHIDIIRHRRSSIRGRFLRLCRGLPIRSVAVQKVHQLVVLAPEWEAQQLVIQQAVRVLFFVILAQVPV